MTVKQLFLLCSIVLISIFQSSCSRTETNADAFQNAFDNKKIQNEAEQLFEKGMKCAQRGEGDKAIEYFEESIETHKHWAAYQNLGLARANRGDLEESIDEYNRSIELNPDNPNVYYNRGNSKARLNDYHGAIEDFSKAIDLNPFFAIAYQNRGVTKVHYFKDTVGGCADLRKALELGAKGADADIEKYCH